MIVLDTSAVCAILFGEAPAGRLAQRIALDPDIAISTASYVEAVTVIGSRHAHSRAEGKREVDAFLAGVGAQKIALDAEQAQIAADAWLRFGRGSRQPSKLNLGDTFAYALAKSQGAPLLYVGDDFAHTDVEPALP